MGWTLIGSGNQTILLLAGAIGVGKSSVTELLSAQHGFERISSGGYLTRVLERNGSKATRSSLVELGDQLDRDTDFEWVVRDVVEEALASQPDYLLWIFDSVRKRKQVEHFRHWAPQRTFLVYLSASEETLRNRFDLRHRGSDQLTSYDTAIDSDNEREARGLDDLADLVLQTDDLTPADIALRIWEEFSVWSKSFS